MSRVALAGISVALFAFIGGYFIGPMLLCVDGCGVAPLNGVLIAGPGGLVLGVALGAFAILKRWPLHTFVSVTSGASVAALALATALSWPEPRLDSQMIQGEIVGCKSPSAVSSEAIARWREMLASEKWMTPRATWEADANRLTSQPEGVVLTLRVLKRRDFWRRRERWRYGRIDATQWRGHPVNEEFFARFGGHECSSYPLGKTGYFVQQWEASSVSPPDILPTFLGLYVIKPVPANWHPGRPAA